MTLDHQPWIFFSSILYQASAIFPWLLLLQKQLSRLHKKEGKHSNTVKTNRTTAHIQICGILALLRRESVICQMKVCETWRFQIPLVTCTSTPCSSPRSLTTWRTRTRWPQSARCRTAEQPDTKETTMLAATALGTENKAIVAGTYFYKRKPFSEPINQPTMICWTGDIRTKKTTTRRTTTSPWPRTDPWTASARKAHMYTTNTTQDEGMRPAELDRYGKCKL